MPYNWQDNISFVLVEPSEQGNIGAAARAIKNMGFHRLVLVNPPPLSMEAFYLAHGAEDVLSSAIACKSLEDALRDKTLVVGTSRRRGRKRGLFISPWEGAKRIFSGAQSTKVALLFGRESRGLYNEEVDSCSFIIQIPSAPSQPSLNLSQAILIVAYETLRASIHKRQDASEDITGVSPVSEGDMKELFRRIEKSLLLIGYIEKGNSDLRDKIMQNFRRIITRASLAKWEINMLHGLCAQIEKRFCSSDIMMQK